MMKKIVASPYRSIRLLLVLPVFAIVFYAFATPEYTYITPNEPGMESVLSSGVAQKEAKGIVVDEDGNPLEGVRILVAKTTTGVTTDAKGRFSISRIPDGSSLIFSCKGYKSYILLPLISSNYSLRVRLVKDPDYQKTINVRTNDGSEIKALVVVDGVISGNGLAKTDPNSIHSINILKDKPAIDKYGDKGRDGVIEILTKKDETGMPAAASLNESKIAVRTIDGSEVNALVVVDGVISKEGIENLDSSSILSMTVLKDDAATDKYGDKGKDGVIEITTKEPKTQKVQTVTPVQRQGPLVVIDGVVTDKNFRDAPKELGYELAIARQIFGKEATDKYGEKGANGVMELTTRKKARESGLKPEVFQRLAPDDYPTFLGRKWTSYREWVNSHVEYPSEARTKQLVGWVSVNFTVELDGSISNPKPLGTPDPILSNEVLRVIASSPKWDPPKNPAVDVPFLSSVNIGFQPPDKIMEEEPFVVVEEMPMYPGGEAELLNFILSNTQYPEEAKADTIQGKVIVRFIVNTEGNTEGISILKGVHPLLDAEAIRVVKLLSGFKPGMQGGKAVPVWFMVPVNFMLPYSKQN